MCVPSILLRSRIGFDLLTHHLNQTGSASVSSWQDPAVACNNDAVQQRHIKSGFRKTRKHVGR